MSDLTVPRTLWPLPPPSAGSPAPPLILCKHLVHLMSRIDPAGQVTEGSILLAHCRFHMHIHSSQYLPLVFPLA